MDSSNYPDFHEKGPASCTFVDPDIFFTDPSEDSYRRDTHMAKETCNRCPYITECLAWAMESREIGVWGGTSDMDRRMMRRKVSMNLRRTSTR